MNSTTIKISVTLASLFLAYVSFSSPTKVTISETGEIKGMINIARESIQGKTFWQQQLVAVTSELNKLHAEPAEIAKLNREINSELAEFQRDAEKMYRDNPDMRPTAAERQADALRDRADSVEQAELDRSMEIYRLERIASLRKIYNFVENRAK